MKVGVPQKLAERGAFELHLLDVVGGEQRGGDAGGLLCRVAGEGEGRRGRGGRPAGNGDYWGKPVCGLAAEIVIGVGGVEDRLGFPVAGRRRGKGGGEGEAGGVKLDRRAGGKVVDFARGHPGGGGVEFVDRDFFIARALLEKHKQPAGDGTRSRCRQGDMKVDGSRLGRRLRGG